MSGKVTRGRPPLPKFRKRSKRIPVLVTHQEHATLLEKAARTVHRNVSTYLREKGLAS